MISQVVIIIHKGVSSKTLRQNNTRTCTICGLYVRENAYHYLFTIVQSVLCTDYRYGNGTVSEKLYRTINLAISMQYTVQSCDGPNLTHDILNVVHL